MQNVSTSLDAEVEYEICSIASSTETTDDLPGPGRLLGKVYVSLGRRLEDGLGRVAVRMGRGPNAVAIKIQKLVEDRSLRPSIRHKKTKEKCKSLARYIT